jgi:integrase
VGGEKLNMTQGDIYDQKRRLKNIKTRINTSEDISERDKDILVNGLENCPSLLSHMQTRGHSLSRVNRYLLTAKRLLEHVDWKIEDVDKTKITEYIGELNTGKICKKNGEPYSESTKREKKKGIRKLYADYAEVYKESLNLGQSFDSDDLINFTLTIDRKFTSPERLPTPNTVRKLVKNAERPRDKAYIMLLWSTGGRHSEILGLKWKDIRFTDKIGKVVFKDTKTGEDHSVPMGEAYPFVFQHQQTDSRSGERDAFVFRSTQTETQLSSNGGAEIIKRIREKESVDIPERIKTNPHAFRKGRTSYWARQGKNETWICKYMNWAPGSKSVRHYCRMAREDVDEGVSQHLGLETADNGEDESKVLTPSECHSCGTINSFETDTCMNCGETLKASDLYKESKIQEMTEEIKSEMIERETGKDREDIRELAEEVIEKQEI